MDKLFVYIVTYTDAAGITSSQICSTWAAGARLARMSLKQRFKDCGYKKVKIECLGIQVFECLGTVK